MSIFRSKRVELQWVPRAGAECEVVFNEKSVLEMARKDIRGLWTPGCIVKVENTVGKPRLLVRNLQGHEMWVPKPNVRELAQERRPTVVRPASMSIAAYPVSYKKKATPAATTTKLKNLTETTTTQTRTDKTTRVEETTRAQKTTTEKTTTEKTTTKTPPPPPRTPLPIASLCALDAAVLREQEETVPVYSAEGEMPPPPPLAEAPVFLRTRRVVEQQERRKRHARRSSCPAVLTLPSLGVVAAAKKKEVLSPLVAALSSNTLRRIGTLRRSQTSKKRASIRSAFSLSPQLLSATSARKQEPCRDADDDAGESVQTSPQRHVSLVVNGSVGVRRGVKSLTSRWKECRSLSLNTLRDACLRVHHGRKLDCVVDLTSVSVIAPSNTFLNGNRLAVDFAQSAEGEGRFLAPALRGVADKMKYKMAYLPRKQHDGDIECCIMLGWGAKHGVRVDRNVCAVNPCALVATLDQREGDWVETAFEETLELRFSSIERTQEVLDALSQVVRSVRETPDPRGLSPVSARTSRQFVADVGVESARLSFSLDSLVAESFVVRKGSGFRKPWQYRLLSIDARAEPSLPADSSEAKNALLAVLLTRRPTERERASVNNGSVAKCAAPLLSLSEAVGSVYCGAITSLTVGDADSRRYALSVGSASSDCALHGCLGSGGGSFGNHMGDTASGKEVLAMDAESPDRYVMWLEVFWQLMAHAHISDSGIGASKLSLDAWCRVNVETLPSDSDRPKSAWKPVHVQVTDRRLCWFSSAQHAACFRRLHEQQAQQKKRLRDDSPHMLRRTLLRGAVTFVPQRTYFWSQRVPALADEESPSYEVRLRVSHREFRFGVATAEQRDALMAVLSETTQSGALSPRDVLRLRRARLDSPLRVLHFDD